MSRPIIIMSLCVLSVRLHITYVARRREMMWVRGGTAITDNEYVHKYTPLAWKYMCFSLGGTTAPP